MRKTFKCADAGHRVCAICGGPNGNGFTTALRHMGYDVPSGTMAFAHSVCMARGQRKAKGNNAMNLKTLSHKEKEQLLRLFTTVWSQVGSDAEAFCNDNEEACEVVMDAGRPAEALKEQPHICPAELYERFRNVEWQKRVQWLAANINFV